MNIDEIIAALETATGPSRDLDEALYGELGYWSSSAKADGPAPAYTASIDAALTLVPEGYGTSHEARGDKASAYANCWLDVRDYNGVPHEGRGLTIALALCAAALRAGQVRS